jgi:hypothetical protein
MASVHRPHPPQPNGEQALAHFLVDGVVVDEQHDTAANSWNTASRTGGTAGRSSTARLANMMVKRRAEKTHKDTDNFHRYFVQFRWVFNGYRDKKLSVSLCVFHCFR